MFSKLRECLLCFIGDIDLPGDPASPLSQKTQEERSAFIDPLQAYLDDILVLGGILFSYSPTQIDIDQAQFSFAAPLR